MTCGRGWYRVLWAKRVIIWKACDCRAAREREA